MIVSLLVAASANEVIGRDGALPWYLPADLRRFRALTTGHVVVMGRLTYQSILGRLGHPLPGRTSVVVSRTLSDSASALRSSRPRASRPHPASAHPRSGGGQVRVAPSVPSALRLAEDLAVARGDTEFFVVGGESVYREALPHVDRVYLTRLHDDVTGDCAMPPGWLTGFELTAREDATEDSSQLRYSFLDYERAPA